MLTELTARDNGANEVDGVNKANGCNEVNRVNSQR